MEKAAIPEKRQHLIDDRNYYIAHQNELVEKYDGKVLVLHEMQVVGAFDTFPEAVEYGRSTFGMGHFSIQECSPGDKDLVVKFYAGMVI